MLNEAKAEVLDALEEHLGAREVNPRYVSEHSDYGRALERMLESLLTTYAEYKYLHSTERAEIERQQRLAREEELRVRSKVIRDNIMTGVLSNMTMKLRKYFPDQFIDFCLGNSGGSVVVYDDDNNSIVSLEYFKHNPTQKYELTTHIEGVGLWEDDVTIVNGNQPPAKQFTGIAGLDAYLDTLTTKEEQ